jgi:hypothetical protein|tara:strand:+ start:8457 stop:9041 length:585 start_codon:yes stop_codon:yes gene_type:complete
MTKSLELEKACKLTKSYDFLLPLTGYSSVDLKPYLVNVYLGDTSLLDWDLDSPDIFVLMKYNGAMHFYNLEKEIEKHEYFKNSYSLFRGRYLMFVFTITEFQKEYDLFLKGKYSKFSRPAKVRLMKHRSNKSAIPFVLDKGQELRTYWEGRLDAQLPENSEVWPIVNYDEELFDRVKFKKQMGINTDLPANLVR